MAAIPVLQSERFCQVAMVVRDIESKAKVWADMFGVEMPKISLTGEQETTHAEFNDAPTAARAKLAFFALGQVKLELIEPVGGPSTWQKFLDTHGEGVHHIAFTTDDMAATVDSCNAKGMPLEQRGDFNNGCYSYIDAYDKMGVMLEFLFRKK